MKKLICILFMLLICASPLQAETIRSGKVLSGSTTGYITSIPNLTEINLNNERNVIVLANKGNGKYLVIEKDNIGLFYYQTSNSCNASNPSRCSNQYKGNDLDTYLSNTWYNSLSTDIKSAIVAQSITEKYYDHVGASSCGKYQNGQGEHPWSTDWTYKWTSSAYTRSVYLPSLDEIRLAGVNFDSKQSIINFLSKDVNLVKSDWGIWTRDGVAQDYSDSSVQRFMFLHKNNGTVRFTRSWNDEYVRPAYVIDLTKVAWRTAANHDWAYSVSIPESMRLSESNSFSYGAYGNYKINVSVSSDNDFKLYSGNNSISYSMPSTSWTSLNGEGQKDLTFNISETPAYAGTYEDRLTFTVALQ